MTIFYQLSQFIPLTLKAITLIKLYMVSIY